MPNFIQLIPVTSQSSPGFPYAFYGLEAGGRLWWGIIDTKTQKDGGPISIEWRQIEPK